MNNYRWNFSYCILSIFLISNIALANAECGKCRNEVIDTDQASFMQDFGPEGIKGPLNITLTNTLQPGAMVSVVTKSDTRGSVNLVADDIYIIHVDARIQKNEMVINTSKRLNLEWMEEVKLPNPVEKCAKTTTTLIYEAEGYRVFINGRKVAFYSHRTSRVPQVLVLYHDYIYKVMYVTTRETGKL